LGGIAAKTWCYLLQSFGYTGLVESEISLPPQQFLKLLLEGTLEHFTLPADEAQDKPNEGGADLGSCGTLAALGKGSSQRHCTWLACPEKSNEAGEVSREQVL